MPWLYYIQCNLGNCTIFLGGKPYMFFLTDFHTVNVPENAKLLRITTGCTLLSCAFILRVVDFFLFVHAVHMYMYLYVACRHVHCLDVTNCQSIDNDRCSLSNEQQVRIRHQCTVTKYTQVQVSLTP